MDVAAIVSVSLAAVAAAAILAWLVWSGIAGRRDAQRVRDHAIAGRARIVTMEELEVGHLWLELELEIPGRPARTMKHSFNAVPGSEPKVGQWMRVRVHPDDANVIFLDGVEP
jgi:hypothetical protein